MQVPGSHKSCYLLPDSIDGTGELTGPEGYGRVL